jgi:hypothetical protein
MLFIVYGELASLLKVARPEPRAALSKTPQAPRYHV